MSKYTATEHSHVEGVVAQRDVGLEDIETAGRVVARGQFDREEHTLEVLSPLEGWRVHWYCLRRLLQSLQH